jgi:hypothetical protein
MLMQQQAETSRNIQTVNTYLDGFRKNDRQQILGGARGRDRGPNARPS